MKRCYICKEIKLLKEFHKDKHKKMVGVVGVNLVLVPVNLVTEKRIKTKLMNIVGPIVRIGGKTILSIDLRKI